MKPTKKSGNGKCSTCRKAIVDPHLGESKCAFCWEVEARLSAYIKNGRERALKRIVKAILARVENDRAGKYPTTYVRALIPLRHLPDEITVDVTFMYVQTRPTARPFILHYPKCALAQGYSWGYGGPAHVSIMTETVEAIVNSGLGPECTHCHKHISEEP